MIFSAGMGLCPAQPEWGYRNDGVGSVLPNASWVVVRTLAKVGSTPEFSFPIQLVYDNANQRSGLFGPQWYSPQLESSLLPGKNGILVWQTPSGRRVGLHAKRGNSREFASGMDYTAKRKGSVVEITSRQDGYIYRYRHGRLQEVESPTHRLLEFRYRQNFLSKIVLQDGLSTARLTVADIKLIRLCAR